MRLLAEFCMALPDGKHGAVMEQDDATSWGVEELGKYLVDALLGRDVDPEVRACFARMVEGIGNGDLNRGASSLADDLSVSLFTELDGPDRRVLEIRDERPNLASPLPDLSFEDETGGFFENERGERFVLTGIVPNEPNLCKPSVFTSQDGWSTRFDVHQGERHWSATYPGAARRLPLGPREQAWLDLCMETLTGRSHRGAPSKKHPGPEP